MIERSHDLASGFRPGGLDPGTSTGSSASSTSGRSPTPSSTGWCRGPPAEPGEQMYEQPMKDLAEWIDRLGAGDRPAGDVTPARSGPKPVYRLEGPPSPGPWSGGRGIEPGPFRCRSHRWQGGNSCRSLRIDVGGRPRSGRSRRAGIGSSTGHGGGGPGRSVPRPVPRAGLSEGKPPGHRARDRRGARSRRRRSTRAGHWSARPFPPGPLRWSGYAMTGCKRRTSSVDIVERWRWV